MTDVFKRDRLILLVALIFLSLLAWAAMFYQATGMDGMMGMCCVPNLHSWRLSDIFNIFMMWAIMMVAMMVPSATPMVLMFASVNRKRKEADNPFVPTWIFLLGYMISWTGFSLLATVLQWFLHSKALLSPMMISTNSIFGGLLLIIAGVFQFSPMKNACLSHCRTPLTFLMTDWKEGKWGALLMGLRHGSFCVGCCWALMSLLFVGGVMNLFWIAIISVFVLIEKIAPKNFRVNQVSGALLIVWGGLMILGKLT